MHLEQYPHEGDSGSAPKRSKKVNRRRMLIANLVILAITVCLFAVAIWPRVVDAMDWSASHRQLAANRSQNTALENHLRLRLVGGEGNSFNYRVAANSTQRVEVKAIPGWVVPPHFGLLLSSGKYVRVTKVSQTFPPATPLRPDERANNIGKPELRPTVSCLTFTVDGKLRSGEYGRASVLK